MNDRAASQPVRLIFAARDVPLKQSMPALEQSTAGKLFSYIISHARMLQGMTTIHYIVAGMIATSGASVAAVNDVWKLTAFLALGSSLGVLWSCLSKQRSEQTRITQARIISGIVGGIIIPRLIERGVNWLTNWAWDMSAWDPILVIGFGFFFSAFGFYVAHSLLRRLETEQEVIGGAIVETAKKGVANKLGIPLSTDAKNEDANPNPGN